MTAKCCSLDSKEIKGLPQEEWQLAMVDMTEARRPDGTGGPLGENERIDDIQFYVDPDLEIVIDDIVLYDAATGGEDNALPFPKRIMFTGGFDTGTRGQHWPGDHEIVPDAGNFWRAMRAVESSVTGDPWIRLELRGQRALRERTHVSVRYRLTGTDGFRVRLLNTKTGQSQDANVQGLKQGEWALTMVEFETKRLTSIDEIHWLLPQGAELLIDDLLLFEPGT